jgi:hypothetical protein
MGLSMDWIPEASEHTHHNETETDPSYVTMMVSSKIVICVDASTDILEVSGPSLLSWHGSVRHGKRVGCILRHWQTRQCPLSLRGFVNVVRESERCRYDAPLTDEILTGNAAAARVCLCCRCALRPRLVGTLARPSTSTASRSRGRQTSSRRRSTC